MSAERDAPGTFLCRVEDVPEGAGIKVDARDADQTATIVVRTGDAIYAYENRCPHFGIPLEIGRGVKTFREHILCVNHYAAFRFADGACIDGPCLGASLAPVPVAVESGRVSRRRTRAAG